MARDGQQVFSRRLFLGGALATGFALTAKSSSLTAFDEPALSGVDILPASGRAPASMVVLLHGFSGNGASMRWMAEAWARLLPDTVFVMPDAPDPCHENDNPASREWYASRARDPDSAARVSQIRRVEPRLNRYIDMKLAHYGLRDSALAIAGISQGAMMALHAGPRRAGTCAGVVSYNGMLVDPAGLRRDPVTRPAIFAAHGRRDDVVSYTHLAELSRDFRAAGFAVETASYDLGHEVNAKGLAEGGAFVRRRLLQAAAPRAAARRRFGGGN